MNNKFLGQFLVYTGVVEVGQVEVGQDYFDWRSTRYLAKTVEVGLVEVGQHKQTIQICFTLSSIENIL